MAIAFDQKGRNAHKWASIRNKQQRDTGRSKGLTGAALDAAVLAMAAADPSLVEFKHVGDS